MVAGCALTRAQLGCCWCTARAASGLRRTVARSVWRVARSKRSATIQVRLPEWTADLSSETSFRAFEPFAESQRKKSFAWSRPDGESTPVFCSAAPIVGADGGVEGAVVTFQDITANKELERLRGEWSSVVAHDLRQPLTSIALNADILAAKSGDPSLKRPIERIQLAAARLSRMVGDLMDLSRLEAQRLELARQRVGVATIVRSTVDAMEIDAPDRPFETHVAPIVPDVEADPDRLAQVMENLLTNAIKYGTPGRPIVVDVGCTNAEVVVAVTNEGHALTPEEMTRIFERFQRTEQARLEGIEGIGLGLFITRAIVEAHGGHITVDSTPAGVTSFRFTLPVRRLRED